jgi:hypothetical protein
MVTQGQFSTTSMDICITTAEMAFSSPQLNVIHWQYLIIDEPSRWIASFSRII